jgi:hypothetical protein
MGEPQGPPHDDPDHPGKPPGDPEHPEHPHEEGPPGQDKPDEEDVPEPTHPIAEPEPETVAFVEPYLGLDEYATVTLERQGLSLAVQAAGKAALTTWMRRHGLDPSGHYTHAEWEAHYAAAMAHT